MDTITAVLIHGLLNGSVFALLSVGFSLVFGVAGILNLAHASFYMMSAFLIFVGTSMLKFPLGASAIFAIFFAGITGIVCYKLLFERVKERETAIILITVSLAMLFQEVFLLLFGANPRRIGTFVSGFFEIGGIRILNQYLVAIGIVGITLFALWVLLKRTKLGNAIRAVAQDREIANVMGINVNRVYLITMGISSVLAGVAGAVVAPIYMVHPFMWIQALTIFLASVVIGGLGSITGSILGAFILGFTETAVVFCLPGGSYLRGAVSLAVMVVVLLLRPEGLFGVVFEEERL